MGAQPCDVPIRVTDLPPVMILADHFGYADGVRHGVTTYLLHVLPLLAAAGVEMTVCFLRAPHAAAADLHALGIRPVFFDAGKWDPTVALRIAGLARHRGVRLLHATGVKGTLAARIAARLTGARTLLHMHDLNDPGALSVAQRLAAQPTDAAVCVSQAVCELAVGDITCGRSGCALRAMASRWSAARCRRGYAQPRAGGARHRARPTGACQRRATASREGPSCTAVDAACHRAQLPAGIAPRGGRRAGARGL